MPPPPCAAAKARPSRQSATTSATKRDGRVNMRPLVRFPRWCHLPVWKPGRRTAACACGPSQNRAVRSGCATPTRIGAVSGGRMASKSSGSSSRWTSRRRAADRQLMRSARRATVTLLRHHRARARARLAAPPPDNGAVERHPHHAIAVAVLQKVTEHPHLAAWCASAVAAEK